MHVPEILYEKDGRVATVTLNRPEAMNALTPKMATDLIQIFDDLSRDDDVWVVILTGAGDKAFCAGADLGQPLSSDVVSEVLRDKTKRFFSEIYKPIIGAVNGYCIAGGLEILQGTDLRLAAEHASFGLGEVRWGIVPGGGSHVRLPRQIPWAVAMELLLTGRPISSERAYDVGLVNRVVPGQELMTEARKLADVLCDNAPLAIRTAKEIAVRALNLESGFVLESVLTQTVLASEDAKEGPRAFMEKRKPNFVGR